jgi:hypothetical protein
MFRRNLAAEFAQIEEDRERDLQHDIHFQDGHWVSILRDRYGRDVAYVVRNTRYSAEYYNIAQAVTSYRNRTREVSARFFAQARQSDSFLQREQQRLADLDLG